MLNHSSLVATSTACSNSAATAWCDNNAAASYAAIAAGPTSLQTCKQAGLLAADRCFAANGCTASRCTANGCFAANGCWSTAWRWCYNRSAAWRWCYNRSTAGSWCYNRSTAGSRSYFAADRC